MISFRISDRLLVESSIGYCQGGPTCPVDPTRDPTLSLSLGFVLLPVTVSKQLSLFLSKACNLTIIHCYSY